jgi:hypothetical protein
VGRFHGPLVERHVLQLVVAEPPSVLVGLLGKTVLPEIVTGETGERVAGLDPLAVAKSEGRAVANASTGGDVEQLLSDLRVPDAALLVCSEDQRD